jgi:hypothetical protein
LTEKNGELVLVFRLRSWEVKRSYWVCAVLIS